MSGGEDNLYEQAVAIVLESGKPSVSYLQRQLRLGYNVAARLVERMERQGLVSSPDHVGRRQLLAEAAVAHPWDRNAGKFDAPSSATPRASVDVLGSGSLASAVRDELERRGLAPVETITVGEVEPHHADAESVECSAEPMGKLSPTFLRGLVAEAEKLIDERRDIALQLKALRDAAKDRGVNIKAFNELLRRREMDARLRDDFDQALGIYETVAGLSRGTMEGGELRGVRALPAPEPPKLSAKSKAMTEALMWAGVPSGTA